jgi:isopropylmalate/homocitrate/citramalate synthase
MKNLFISDVTLRQESKRTEAILSFREKLEIARSLDRLRLYSVELPAIQNEKAATLLLTSSRPPSGRAALCCP